MTGTLASITLRSLLNRRRTLLLALASALVVLVAALFRLSSPTDDEALMFTGRLLADFGIGVVLPLVAVIVGTAAIGSEIEDGTIVYLLAKPIPRLTIVVVKMAVAWLVTCAIVVPGIWIAGIVATGGSPDLGTAYSVAAIVGALEYTAVFVALSLVTSRALVVGLAYVVIWEGVVAGLFAATRLLSVRQHALWVADAIGGEGAVASDLGPQAILILAIVTAAAFVIAVRRLERVELRGETG
jgi:ABC-2 type transport system permease protein